MCRNFLVMNNVSKREHKNLGYYEHNLQTTRNPYSLHKNMDYFVATL